MEYSTRNESGICQLRDDGFFKPNQHRPTIYLSSPSSVLLVLTVCLATVLAAPIELAAQSVLPARFEEIIETPSEPVRGIRGQAFLPLIDDVRTAPKEPTAPVCPVMLAKTANAKSCSGNCPDNCDHTKSTISDLNSQRDACPSCLASDKTTASPHACPACSKERDIIGQVSGSCLACKTEESIAEIKSIDSACIAGDRVVEMINTRESTRAVRYTSKQLVDVLLVSIQGNSDEKANRRAIETALSIASSQGYQHGADVVRHETHEPSTVADIASMRQQINRLTVQRDGLYQANQSMMNALQYQQGVVESERNLASLKLAVEQLEYNKRMKQERADRVARLKIDLSEFKSMMDGNRVGQAAQDGHSQGTKTVKVPRRLDTRLADTRVSVPDGGPVMHAQSHNRLPRYAASQRVPATMTSMPVRASTAVNTETMSTREVELRRLRDDVRRINERLDQLLDRRSEKTPTRWHGAILDTPDSLEPMYTASAAELLPIK